MKKVFTQVAKASAVIKAIMALQVFFIGWGVAQLFQPGAFNHGLFMIALNGAFLYMNYKWNTATQS